MPRDDAFLATVEFRYIDRLHILVGRWKDRVLTLPDPRAKSGGTILARIPSTASPTTFERWVADVIFTNANADYPFDDGRMTVGAVGFSSDSAWIAVAEDYQRRGVATELWKHAVEQGYVVGPEDRNTPQGQALWRSIQKEKTG